MSHWLTDSSKIKWFIANACKYLLDESLIHKKSNVTFDYELKNENKKNESSFR